MSRFSDMWLCKGRRMNSFGWGIMFGIVVGVVGLHCLSKCFNGESLKSPRFITMNSRAFLTPACIANLGQELPLLMV